jgi:hypothetical protein
MEMYKEAFRAAGILAGRMAGKIHLWDLLNLSNN